MNREAEVDWVVVILVESRVYALLYALLRCVAWFPKI